LKVRWARPDDAGAIAAVHIGSWLGAYRGLVPEATLSRLSAAERTRQWLEWLRDPTRPRTLVADRGEGIEGFCSLAMPARGEGPDSDLAEIPAFYVAPDAWRMGIGSALMTRALAEMVEAGFSRAVIWVLEGNDRAIAFYEATGWRLDGGRDRWTPQLEGAEALPVLSLRIDLDARRR
jgi:GNAT superfamily N-acetyltransferase